MNPRFISWGLLGLGVVVTAAWCALVLPALLVADSGAGLTLGERASLASPLAAGSALLIVGSRRAARLNPPRSSPVLTASFLVGIAGGVGALLLLLVPS